MTACLTVVAARCAISAHPFMTEHFGVAATFMTHSHRADVLKEVLRGFIQFLDTKYRVNTTIRHNRLLPNAFKFSIH